MRLAAWGTALATACAAAVAQADIYRYRDPGGALVFTNAPSIGASPVGIKEPPMPPAGRMMVTRGYLQSILSRPIPTPDRTAYDELIREMSARYGVQYSLVKAVIKAESDFDRHAVSRAGALGLMQLMPATAAFHRVRDVFLPRDNIEGGCRHLRMLLDRYGGNVPLAVAAYNAGTQRVEEAGGIPAIPETREYLARVLRYRLAYMREGADDLEVRR